MNPWFAPRTTSAISVILVINIALYVIELLPGIGPLLTGVGALVPAEVFGEGQVWRLLTYMFLHDPGSPFHLMLNMLALWMFGTEIEQLWGKGKFVRFYLIAGAGSGCFSLIHLFSPVMKYTGVIGASGAILALLTVYAFIYPHRQVLLFFVLPVNIRLVVIGYALISLFGTISPHGVVSHITHLGGIVVAFCYMGLYPLISKRLREKTRVRDERSMRRQAESAARKRRFFEERIDPILDKISREGSDSLTGSERRILKKAAGSGNRDLLKKGPVIPFDLFRRRRSGK